MQAVVAKTGHDMKGSRESSARSSALDPVDVEHPTGYQQRCAIGVKLLESVGTFSGLFRAIFLIFFEHLSADLRLHFDIYCGTQRYLHPTVPNWFALLFRVSLISSRSDLHLAAAASFKNLEKLRIQRQQIDSLSYSPIFGKVSSNLASKGH